MKVRVHLSTARFQVVENMRLQQTEPGRQKRASYVGESGEYCYETTILVRITSARFASFYNFS